MDNSPRDPNAEPSNNGPSSSATLSSEMESIAIDIQGIRHGAPFVTAQALMSKWTQVSRLSYSLVEDLRNATGGLIEMDLGMVKLQWRIGTSGQWYRSKFEVVDDMGVDVILASDQRGEKDKSEEALALKLRTTEKRAEALRVTNERDDKRNYQIQSPLGAMIKVAGTTSAT